MSGESGLQSRTREADLTVRSLVIPLNGMSLLVPNALVSEVATLATVMAVPGKARWLLGTMEWRGLRVPVLSFEGVASGAVSAPARNSRAIVFNTLNNNRDLPFLAVLSQRIPRLLLVTARMLQRADGASAGDAVLTRLKLQDEDVLVPDMDRLEQLLQQQGVRVERVIG